MKTGTGDRVDNIRSALSRGGLRHFTKPFPLNDKTALVVGGAPSIGEKIGELKRRQRRGDVIWSVNGSHDFLLKHGITPDFCTILDQKSTMADEVTPTEGVTYLVASCCHPSTFDLLKDHSPVLWHAMMGSDEELGLLMQWRKQTGGNFFMIPGGCTVGLRSLYLAFFHGHQKIHVYGLDSSFTDKTHAYKDRKKPEKVIEITVEGRTFQSMPIMGRQVQDFQGDYRELTKCGCRISVSPVKGALLPFVYSTMTDRDKSWSRLMSKVPALEEYAWGPLHKPGVLNVQAG